MAKYEDWIKPEGLIRIEGWARDGLTNEQIASNIGVTAKTIYEWQNKHSDICDALKRGKDVPDREVENALKKRAMGYEYDEITFEYGEEVKRVRKQVAPDVTAQIFWLKNRKPKEWRDRQELEHSGEISQVVIVDDISKLKR